MLTGVISCSTGMTSAPPLSTTFSPRKPVRTKAVSLVESRYSHLSTYTAITMRMTAMSSVRMKLPKFSLVMLRSPGSHQAKLMSLNLRVCSVKARSVGRRSIDEAP